MPVRFTVPPTESSATVSLPIASSVGSSLTATMVKFTTAVSVSGSGAPFVVPLSVIVYSKLAGPKKFSVGVNTTSPPTTDTVPPTAAPAAVIVSVWRPSFGPALSFASSSAAVNVNGPPSSLYGPAGLSFIASGASLISVIVMVKVSE